jgi:Na+-transporting NADH:ubiquinone oxidoreductase subunit B
VKASTSVERDFQQQYVTSDLTSVAPHVRNPLNVRVAMRCVLVAAVPCVLMALYNTGYQANLALSQGISPSGWRTRVLGMLGLGHSPTSPLDCMFFGGLFFVPLLIVVWLAGGLSEQCFARARGRRADHMALPVIAVLLSLSLPATLPLWQAALGSTIGFIVGKEIFGGFGRNFVNPVVAGLAFLYFAYPGAVGGDTVWVPIPGHVGATPLAIATRSGLDGIHAAGMSWSSTALGWVPGAMGETSALACLLGLVVLLYTGVASWRIVASGALGLTAGVCALQSLDPGQSIAQFPWHWHLVSGSFAFGLVYLATDPVTAATTNAGRWLYGGLIGVFVAVVRIANPAHQDGVILALLLGNVTAPLLDRTVAFAQLRWNRASRGGWRD